MIERYLVRYFLAVVDCGTFSRAARQCGVSQPTLSTGIAKLEALAGAVLLHRSSRRIALTAAGTRFAVHARRIETEFARAHAAVAEDRRKLVSIGVLSTLPSAWVEAAARAAAAAPGEQLELVEGRMQELVPRLDRGRIAAILGMVGGDERAREPLFEEGYALAMAADHPLAPRGEIAAGEVADAPMIVRRQCEALPEISRFFTRRGVRPFFAARTTSDDRAAALVRAGLGITVMPRGFAQPGIAMVDLAGFTQRRRIGFLVDPASARRLDDSACFASFGAAIRAAATGN